MSVTLNENVSWDAQCLMQLADHLQGQLAFFAENFTGPAFQPHDLGQVEPGHHPVDVGVALAEHLGHDPPTVGVVGERADRVGGVR